MKKEQLEANMQVTSLAEFISAISLYPSDRFLFRGENAYYAERVSASFRPFDGSWHSKKDHPFIELSKRFYDEVAHRISEFERAHFIAFSQHHGIPTNLLDITSSPLIALYFACLENEKGDRNQRDQYGYVYIFDDDYVDITSILEKYPNENVLDLLTSDNSEILSIWTKLFEQYRSRHLASFNACFDLLVDSLKHYFQLDEDVLLALDDCEDTFGYDQKYLNIISAFNGNHEHIMPINLYDGNAESFAFMCLLRTFFMKAKNYQEPIHGVTFLPNLYYKPLLVFERGRNQHSSFMYQAYLSYTEQVYNYYVLMKQRIHHKICIRIENKDKILRDLDNIGINRKTIFSDFDNIANYICLQYNQ